jgi:hypothetical protein
MTKIPGCCINGMPGEVCGIYALNAEGLRVEASDTQLVIAGKTHQYFCRCKCGDEVTLKRGNKIQAHFAFRGERRPGCKGGSNPESEIHYDAKWLLSKIFPQIDFFTFCVDGHPVGKDRFRTPEWTATVETVIPKTNRIADVLLYSSVTGKYVALEVHNTNAVTMEKYNDCKAAGVTIIEVKAIMKIKEEVTAVITKNTTQLDNQLDKISCADCIMCQDLKKRKDAAKRKRREEDEQEELEWQRYRHKKKLEREAAREQAASRELELAAQMASKEIELAAQNAAKELELAAQNAARDAENLKQTKLQAETRAREKAARVERQRVRKEERVKFLVKMEELHKLLSSAKRKAYFANTIHSGNQHGFTLDQRARQLKDRDACEDAVKACDDAIEMHTDTGRGKRSRVSRANAGCIACAGSMFRCAAHDDRDTETWV